MVYEYSWEICSHWWLTNEQKDRRFGFKIIFIFFVYYNQSVIVIKIGSAQCDHIKWHLLYYMHLKKCVCEIQMQIFRRNLFPQLSIADLFPVIEKFQEMLALCYSILKFKNQFCKVWQKLTFYTVPQSLLTRVKTDNILRQS